MKKRNVINKKRLRFWERYY